jgi:hypothetical protein
MGWTDDADTEGIWEENFIMAMILGVLIIGTVSILHFVGISYDPGWFEGQNIFSTMGIVFLLVGIAAIGFSTFTGKSDLVKWEAFFLLIAVGMIYVGNNLDIDSFIQSFDAEFSSWLDISWTSGDLLTLVLIVTLIAMAVSSVFGKGIGIGSAILAVICIVGIFLLNNPGVAEYFSSGTFFEKSGEAMQDMTNGVIDADLGAALGVGVGTAAAGAAIGSVVPGIGTGVGAVVGFLGGTGVTIFGGNAGWW